MASSCPSPLIPRSFLAPQDSLRLYAVERAQIRRGRRKANKSRHLTLAAANAGNAKPAKLVTFLGKGGSGKTSAAVFAAQHYAMLGLKTCLVIHSQDPTAEHILNCKIGPSPVECDDNLSAVRLQTTKVVGEELGVLPGMDSIFSSLELEWFLGFFMSQRNSGKARFDIVVYDGISTEETIRMIGATSKARLYLKYVRMLAEKTDLGRVLGPSLLRIVDDTLSLSGNAINPNERTSSDIWDYLEKTLEKGSCVFADPRSFRCYLVMNPNNPISVNSALRYWGCAIQAGTQVSGVLGQPSADDSPLVLSGSLMTSFAPLPCAFLPHLNFNNQLHWNEIMASDHSKCARDIFSMTCEERVSSVKFDPLDKSVELFMPGFEKSEIKLSHFRGGSELFVEAGDQRRVVRLPSQIQGKVGGAKFVDRRLVITMRQHS